MRKQKPPKRETKDTLIVRHQRVPVMITDLRQSELRFYPDNPRIYSLVRTGEEEPTQQEIEKRLLEREHVKELITDIRTNGGLIEALIVKDGSLEVLEGNSRLAAYRYLAKANPVKWGMVKCMVLPSNIGESLVFAILGQHHIRGKKNWVPYEQAGFLYRRHKKHNIHLDALSKEIGLSRKTVKHLIKTYQFMLDNEEADTNRWSYYDEYLKSSKIRKIRKKRPQMDPLIIDKIRSGEIERAVDVRDQLPVVCAGPPKNLKRFLAGQIPLATAYEIAHEAGGDDSSLRRLTTFRQWIVQDKVKRAFGRSEGQIRKKLIYELGKLYVRVRTLRNTLGAD